MRSRFIQNEILILLSDNKVHTAHDIAEELEVSDKTIYRHIRDLSLSYEIVTGFSGKNRGVQLISGKFCDFIFSQWEIDFLLQLIPMDTKEIRVKSLIVKLNELKQRYKAEI